MNIHTIFFIYGREPQSKWVVMGGSEKPPAKAPVAESSSPPEPLPCYRPDEPPAPEHIGSTFARAAAVNPVIAIERDSHGGERRMESHQAVFIPAVTWTPSEPLQWEAGSQRYKFITS